MLSALTARRPQERYSEGRHVRVRAAGCSQISTKRHSLQSPHFTNILPLIAFLSDLNKNELDMRIHFNRLLPWLLQVRHKAARAYTPGREEPAAREALNMGKTRPVFFLPTFRKTPPSTL